MRRVMDRLGTTRLDLALAIFFAAAGLVQVVFFPIAPGPLGALYVLGSTLPLAWRRTRPLESSMVSSVFWLVPLDGYPVLGFVVVLLQFFALGSRGAPRIAVAAVTCGAAVVSVVGTLVGPEPAVAAIGGVLAVVAPVLVGQVVAQLREQNAELSRLAAALQVERRKVEAAAVGAERARIAQELHDVVGHELTLIAIQAEAAGAALRLMPDRAAEPVEAIRQTAHRTLTEIRAVLDVLAPREGVRSAADRDDLAGGMSLPELSRRANAAGIPNSLEMSGDAWPDQLPPALAVNRIVRECLTNAGRHAPGERVDVTVEWLPHQVRVRARNRTRLTRRPPSGRGLTGLRHRAELLGGTFEARVQNGCFEVEACVPGVAAR